MPTKELRYSDFAEFINIDELEAALNFEPLYQNGEEDTGYCPLPWGLHKHGDTTGKFSINREKRVYGCWVCGGGSLLDLAMAVNGFTDWDEATEWLYQFATDTEESAVEWRDKMLARLNPARPLKHTMPYFNERVLDQYECDRHPFWASRGISLDTAHKYRLGFAPEYKKRNPKDHDEVYYGPAVLIPHFWLTKLVGWQVRWLDDDRPKWVAKYGNTPDFPKQETVFNFDDAISLGYGPVIVVESGLTVLALKSLGYNTVGTFGSNVNEQQMAQLTRFPQGVILAADNDPPGKNDEPAAGVKWRDALTEYLKDFVPVKHVELVGEEGSGNDLGDLIKEGLIEEVDMLIEEAYDPLSAKLGS
jgi:DNA primase